MLRNALRIAQVSAFCAYGAESRRPRPVGLRAASLQNEQALLAHAEERLLFLPAYLPPLDGGGVAGFSRGSIVGAQATMYEAAAELVADWTRYSGIAIS